MVFVNWPGLQSATVPPHNHLLDPWIAWKEPAREAPAKKYFSQSRFLATCLCGTGMVPLFVDGGKIGQLGGA